MVLTQQLISSALHMHLGFLTLNTLVLMRPCDGLASVTVACQYMKSKDKAKYSMSLSEAGIHIQGHR